MIAIPSTVATTDAPAAVPTERHAGDIDHLSWSSIQSYAACPRRYEYRYMLGLPEERRSACLAFGSAIHSAVEKVGEARIEGREIPTLDSLLSAYNDAWRQATEGPSPVQYGKKEDEHLLRGLATRMLLAYRRHAAELKGEVIAVEHAARFALLPDCPPMEARLDLVEVEGDALALTDLKTAKCSWNNQTIQAHLPQLILYAHSGDELRRGLGLKRVKPRFVIVTKARDPKIQVIEPPVGQADVDRLKESVGQTWHAIKSGAFVRREGWQCQSCPFRRRCLGR